MKEPFFKKSMNLRLLAAVLLFGRPAVCGALSSGADYQMEYSVIDNGGGEDLTGGEYFTKSAIGQESLPPNLGLSSGGGYSNRTGFYNPPHFTYQAGLPIVLSMASGDIRLTLPANSVEKSLFEITMNNNPADQPLAADPDKIANANSKMVNNEGAWSQLFSSNLLEMSIFDDQSFYTKPLANRGVLSLRYKDDDNDGILDGSNPPVRANTLNAWILDEVSSSWVQMPEAAGDRSSKMLSVYFGQPGVYALFGAQDLAVRNVKAYPVPFRPNGPQAGSGQGQTGTEAGGITFENIPQAGNIEIYTLDGRLVKKIGIPENLPIQKLVWDVKTSSGEKAASGVYIWRVVSGGESKTGKLMVIW